LFWIANHMKGELPSNFSILTYISFSIFRNPKRTLSWFYLSIYLNLPILLNTHNPSVVFQYFNITHKFTIK
jgi:hypothetical protein